jgi:cytochrome c oxidase assembly protein subunit 15
MDFANGFHLWRELGKTADSSYLPFAALTAIHWAHRSFALVVFTVLGALAWHARGHRTLRPHAKALALLLAAQFLSGLVTVVWSWPLAAAVLHNAGAAGLVVAVVLINYRIHPLGSAAPPVLQTSAAPTIANATGS